MIKCRLRQDQRIMPSMLWVCTLKFMCWRLNSNTKMLRGGTFERWLCYESPALINGLMALFWEWVSYHWCVLLIKGWVCPFFSCSLSGWFSLAFLPLALGWCNIEPVTRCRSHALGISSLHYLEDQYISGHSKLPSFSYSAIAA